MKKILNVLLISVIVIAATSLPVQDVQAEEKTRQTASLSPKVGKKLLELQELAQTEQCALALTEAQTMLTWPKLSGYEKVQIYNFMGYCNYTTGNLNGSVRAYENVLAQGDAVPLGIEQSILQTVSSIYLQQENYTKALESIAILMSIVPEPTAELWVLKGQAHYQAGQYPQVVQPINRALKMYKDLGKAPKENWLLMARHAAFELNNFKAMTGFIRDLIRYYPKDTYISQLAGVYSQTGANSKFLVLTEVLYEGDYKTDASTIKNLSQLYLMEDVPYKAAKLLDKETRAGRLPDNLANKKLRATAWFQARNDDRAIPLLKEAADLSKDPELYIRLGQSLMNKDRWEEAASAMKNALRYKVKNKKAANTMLGMIYLQLKKLDQASKYFLAAGDSKAWIDFIENEKKIQEELAKDIEIEVFEKDELLENTDLT